RLDGEVQVLANLLQARHGIDQLGKHEARVRGDEANPFEARNLVELVEHVVKANRPRPGTPPLKGLPIVHALTIGVHGLTQESDLPPAPVGERLCLVDDFPDRPADLFPSSPGNDAKGASLIAAAHYRDEGLGRAWTQVPRAGEARRRVQIELERGYL